MYKEQRARISTQQEAAKARIATAENTITTLKAEEKDLDGKKGKEADVKAQQAKIKVLVAEQEEIIKTETAIETKAAKLLDELETNWKKTKTAASKLKSDLKRAQESYEDAQRKLGNEVEVKAKKDEYKKQFEANRKTLQQKKIQVDAIMD